MFVIIYGMIMIPALIISYLGGSMGAENAFMIIGIAFMVIAWVVYFLSTLMIMIFIGLQYFNLVEKCDAPSLHERIEQINSEEENPV